MASRNLTSPSVQRVNVLAITPKIIDQRTLTRIFAHSDWKLFGAGTLREAKDLLREEPISVVICEQELPDGTWKDLLEELSHAERPPHLVVTSRMADDQLWAEVLNRGGYDVLAQPFDPTEVFRVVSLAWRHWRDSIRMMPTVGELRASAALA